MSNVIQSAISSIRNKASEILNDNQGWFRGGKFTPVQQVQRIGSDLGYQARDLYNQTNQNAWSPGGTNTRVVNAIQGGINNVANWNRYEIPKPQVKSKIGQTAINLGFGIPESIINTPRNYLTGIARTGLELGTAKKEGRQVNLQNLAGGIAPLTESLIDVGTFGGGTVAKNLLKEGAKQTVGKAILKQGAKGAGMGALGGATYGLDQQYGKDFNAGEVATSVAGGALLGGVIGGGLGGVSAVKTKLFGGYKSLGFDDKTAKELTNKHFIRSENVPVKLTTPNQRKVNTEINTVLKRPLNSPIYSDDLKKYQSIKLKLPDTEIGMGLSTKSINRNNVLTEQGISKGVIPEVGGKITPQTDIVPQMEQFPQGKLKLKVNNKPIQGLQDSQLPDMVVPKTSEISQLSISKKGKLNTDKLNITPEQKVAIDQIQDNVPVTVIGNKDVIKESKLTTGSKKAMTDDQMKKVLASQLNSRQEVVSLTRQFEKLKKSGANELELTALKSKIIDQSRIAQQEGTLAGRQLQARNILANELATPEQKIYALLDNAGIDKKKYIKDAINVDFNDATQAVNFYRKYVPPKFSEILTEIRYTNMLSSPLTQIVNTFSNIIQSGIVKPIEKTVTGGLDFISSKFTGKERQYFASQGIDYTKGYVSALPEAWKKFKNIASGKEMSIRPDLEHIPTATKGALKWYSAPLRVLEASDQFFRTLVKSGERKSLTRLNLSESEIAKRAEQSADYTLFRQKFDPTGELGQGVVLKTWDKWNSAIQNLRKVPGGNWILPFIQTPTNILKQGVEYSPLGVSTMIGAKRPLEQLSKAIIGTTVFASLYGIADKGATTWDVPSNAKEKELFYSAGMQPYSVKIGNKWVSYSKLGPLSYPLAMVSALKWAEKNNPDQGVVGNLQDALGEMVGFFGDQSYVSSIGDFINTMKSGYGIKNAVSGEITNMVGQLIPYKSFQGWLTRMIDPTYRKPEGMLQNIQATTPGLSTGVPAYKDIYGQDSKRDLPVYNSFSPLKVSVEKPEQANLLQQQQDLNIEKAQIKKQGEALGLGDAKTSVENGGEAQTIGNVIVYYDEGVKTLDLKKMDDISALPSDNKYNSAIKESKQYSEAAKIMDNTALTTEQQQTALDRLGIDKTKADYYRVANDSDNLKTMFVMDAINKVKTEGGGFSDVIQLLANQRTEVNSKMIASNGVLDNLVDEGILSKAQATQLKKYKFENGQLTPKTKTGTQAKKAKKISVTLRKMSAPKLSSSRTKVKRISVPKLTYKKTKARKLRVLKVAKR